MLTEEQLANRCNGIGASDSPIIMGYSSYKTPYELYLEKTGLVSVDVTQETEQQYWGNALESVILARFTEETGLYVSFPDTQYHPIYPFCFANLDGWVVSERAVVEVKCVNSFQRHQWDTSLNDGIPMAYLIQIAKQCAIMDAAYGYCAVLIGGMEYQQFKYERDLELEDLIIKKDIEFWQCVQQKTPPDLISISDCRLRYKNAQKDKTKETSFAIEKSLVDFFNLKVQISAIDDRMDKAKQKIMEFMGDSEFLVDNNGEIRATWKQNKKGHRVFTVRT